MNELPQVSTGDRLWRNTFFVLSAGLGALALFDFDAGRFAQGVGNLGAAVLTLSLMVRFPFVRALLKVSAEQTTSPSDIEKRRQVLVDQAAKLSAENPWADHAGRAGWTMLAVSLLLRVVGLG